MNLNVIRKKLNDILNDDKGLFQRGSFTPIRAGQQAIQSWASKPQNYQTAQNLISLQPKKPIVQGVREVAGGFAKDLVAGGRQFGVGIGGAIRAPIEQRRLQSIINTDTSIADRYQDLAIKLRQSNPYMSNRLFTRAGQLYKGSGQQAMSQMPALEKGKKDIVSGGIKTAQSILGANYTLKNPLMAGLGMGLGGLSARLQGKGFYEGAGKGLSDTMRVGSVVQFTNPIIAGLVGKSKTLVNNPLFTQLMTRAIGGMGNVTEDEFIARLDQRDPSSVDRLTSFALGAVMFSSGKAEDWESLKKNTKEAIIKGGSKLGLDVRPARLKWSNGDNTPVFIYELKQRMRKLDFPAGNSIRDVNKDIDTFGKRVAQSNVKIPIKQQVDPLEALKAEARKYKSAEEFVKGRYDATPISNSPENIKWFEQLNQDLNSLNKNNFIKSLHKDKTGKVTVNPEVKLKQLINNFNKKYGTNITREDFIEGNIPDRNGLHINRLNKQLTDLYNQSTTPKVKSTEVKPPQGGNLTPQQIEANKKLPRIMFTTNKRVAEGKAVDPFIKGLEKDQKIKVSNNAEPPPPKVPVTSADTSFAGVRSVYDKNVDQSFKDWVNTRRASKVEGYIKAKEFSDLDSKGVEGIFEFQRGNKTGRLAEMKKYFDTKREDVIKTGVDVRYKQDYLPQLWKNSKEEVDTVFQRSLTKTPSFSLQSLIKNYEEGIRAGLTPRFTKLSELAGWYEKTANKTIADRNFFQKLAEDGLIQPSKIEGWKVLNPESFPKVKVQFEKNGKTVEHTGVYYAPVELAEKINAYLQNPEMGTKPEILLNKIANFASSTKNRMLSFGIPKTGINFHGFNILARSYMERGVGGALETAYYMVNPKAAEKRVSQLLSTAPDATKSGLTFSIEGYKDAFEEPSIKSKFGEVWNNLFEKPLFEKIITAKKLEGWNKLWKEYAKNMDEKTAKREASQFMNTIFAGKNIDEIARSKNVQNIFRTIVLTPDWLESNVNLGKNMIKSMLDFSNPVGKAYRRATTNLIAGYVALNLINKVMSGRYMWQNSKGNEFNVAIGYTEDGQERYWRPFGTAADFVRLPYEILAGLLQGDMSVIGQRVRNRLSTVAQPAMSLSTNTDVFGNPLFGKTKYGQEMTLPQNLAGAYNVGSSLLGVPAFISRGLDYATGKTGKEQALLQSLELPLRYSGGAYSTVQKQIKPLIQDKTGKEKFNIYQDLKGQSKFSDNQMVKIAQTGGDFYDILKKREENANDKKIVDEIKEKSGQTVISGSKIYIPTDEGGVKTIDISRVSSIPEEPELTGNTELDKKLMSKYKSEITKRSNDVVELYEAGYFSKEQAESLLNKLIKKTEEVTKSTSSKKTSSKKTKKITLKAIKRSNIKVVAPKISKLTVKQGSSPIKISLKKTPTIKLSTTKQKSKATQLAEAIRKAGKV